MGAQANNVKPTRVQYLADGVQTHFPYTFAILDEGDLQVFLDETPVTDGFTVTGAGNAAGGEVIFAAPPPQDGLVTLRRFQIFQRTTDFPEGGILRARLLNDELDRLTLGLQQLDEQFGRCAQLPVTLPANVDPTLPPPQSRRALLWDTTEDKLINSSFDPDSVLLATEAARDDAVAAREGALAAWMAAGAVFPTQADLRAHQGSATAPNVAFLSGYRSDFDGGEGYFIWNKTSTTPDDGGVVIRPDAVAPGAPGRWVRCVGASVRPEWWGAYGNGTNAAVTRTALQAAVDFAAASSNGLGVLLAGANYAIDDTIVKASSYRCPSIRGRDRVCTKITYSFATAKPALKIIGGSGADSGGLIERVDFAGSGTSRGIEVAGQCMLLIRDCRFDTNAVGVLLHNEATHSFTEYVVMENCVFGPGCATALEYRISNGNSSFNGSGLRNCLIDTAAGNTAPAIKIGASASVYHAPMSFQIWTRNASTVVHLGEQAQCFVHGNITVETFTAPAALFGGWNRAFLVGTIMCWGASLALGTVHLCDEHNILSNGTIRGVAKDFHNNVSLPAGGGPITLHHGSLANSELLAMIEITATNYVYKYLLLLSNDGFGNTPITQLANQRTLNMTGWGAPTFSWNGAALTITNPNYPANVAVAVYVKHMGFANYTGAR